MIVLDGSEGEGGGQILRTALTLSVCLNKPFRIERIRANRSRPGLQPQHLAAVKAAATISHAEVSGTEKDSQTLVFKPDRITAGSYQFAIGTAGSTSLVLQTILPALMLAEAPSTLVLEGGTHNPFAPPFEFLQYAFLPLINKLGATVSAKLERPGFAPAGAGKVSVSITPTGKIQPINIMARGKVIQTHAKVLLSNLPIHIAEREMDIIRQSLSLPEQNLHILQDNSATGPGNLVSITVQSEHVSECITAFGKKGVPAERVAEQAVKATQAYLNAKVPIGSYLADQLLIYLALAAKGQFVTLQPSLHTLTNISVIQKFLGKTIVPQQLDHDCWKISCGG